METQPRINNPPQTISPAPSANISLPTKQPMRPTHSGICSSRANPQNNMIGLLVWALTKVAINVTTATTIQVSPTMRKTARSAFLRPSSRFDIARDADTLRIRNDQMKSRAHQHDETSEPDHHLSSSSALLHFNPQSCILSIHLIHREERLCGDAPSPNCARITRYLLAINAAGRQR
jgi:hypothetical protein